MAKKIENIKRPWVQERKPFERENPNSKFYNSRAWRKLRKQFLMENPLCFHCQQKDEITPATVADHVVPINKGGAALDENNLQPLCASCHNRKSARDRG